MPYSKKNPKAGPDRLTAPGHKTNLNSRRAAERPAGTEQRADLNNQQG